MITDHYNLTVTVNRRAYTQDAIGGKVTSNTLIGTASGRVRNLSGSEVAKLGKDSDRDWVRIYTSGEFDIQPLDEITITGSDGNMNGVYEVRRRNAPQTSMLRHHWELDSVRYT
jgi:head-tail adaptor